MREILDVDMDEREAAFKALQYNVSALEAYQTLQQIYGNLITYCKNVVVSGGIFYSLHISYYYYLLLLLFKSI